MAGKKTRDKRGAHAAQDTQRSDVLVLFGVTGDLAYKMIFPALYALARKGRLDMPVIGVAYSGWTLARLRRRVDGQRQATGQG